MTDGSFHEKFSREKNDVTLNYYLGMLGGVTSYEEYGDAGAPMRMSS